MDFRFLLLYAAVSPRLETGTLDGSSRRKRPTVDGPVLRHGESLFLFLHEVERQFVADPCLQDLEDRVIWEQKCERQC